MVELEWTSFPILKVIIGYKALEDTAKEQNYSSLNPKVIFCVLVPH